MINLRKFFPKFIGLEVVDYEKGSTDKENKEKIPVSIPEDTKKKFFNMTHYETIIESNKEVIKLQEEIKGMQAGEPKTQKEAKIAMHIKRVTPLLEIYYIMTGTNFPLSLESGIKLDPANVERLTPLASVFLGTFDIVDIR